MVKALSKLTFVLVSGLALYLGSDIDFLRGHLSKNARCRAVKLKKTIELIVEKQWKSTAVNAKRVLCERPGLSGSILSKMEHHKLLI